MSKRYRFRTRTFQVLHEPTIDFGAVTGPDDVVPLLKAIVRDASDGDKETVVVLALNARGHVVGYKIVSVGTTTASLVHPKLVLDVAFAFASAVSLIVAHTHPSQDPTPSAEDVALTERLMAAGELLGIPILDHIVLASSGTDESTWSSIASVEQRRLRPPASSQP